jgi:membrane protease YdiL (CAAX protease family)
MTQTKPIVFASPFIITAVNVVVALYFGELIGKWAFVPIILIEWVLFLFFIFKFGDGTAAIKKWLGKSHGSNLWGLFAVSMGLITLPLFLLHYQTLAHWSVWLPWISIALINPWIEEFYYRGFLLDQTQNWNKWAAILFSSLVFSMNHAVFGINSEVNSGLPVLVSTFIMGLIWAIVYLKTKSLRWTVFAHFLVDFFNLSAAAFLDLFKTQW